jgi:hypothetical protein
MDATIGDPSVATSVERVFETQALPGTWGQVTFRSMAISVVLGTVFGFVGLRIMMKAGIIQALNLPINVLSFFFLKWFINLLRACGFTTLPFSRQENVLILTTVTTCLNVAISGKNRTLFFFISAEARGRAQGKFLNSCSVSQVPTQLIPASQ